MKKRIGIFLVCMLFIGMSILPSINSKIQFGKNVETNTINESDFESLANIDWWPTYQHDFCRSGFSTSEAPDYGILDWEFYVEPQEIPCGFCSPIVVDWKIYINNIYTLFCLNANDSTILWNNSIGSNIGNSPTYEDGKLYVSSFLDPGLRCLDAETGITQWFFKAKQAVETDCVISGDYLYFAANDDNNTHKWTIFCLNKKNGVKVWSKPIGGAWWSSPSIEDGRVYIGAEDGVHCFNAINGNKIWQYSNYDAISSPTVVNERVYIGLYDNNLYCFEADSGEILWKYESGGWVQSTPAVAYNRVFINSQDGNVTCLDAITGAIIWQYRTGYTLTWSSPSVADGKVFVGSGKYLYCFDSDTGERLWRYNTGNIIRTSPAIANGKVYICSDTRKLYCFVDGNPNNPPSIPIINGPPSGRINKKYTYTVSSTDSENDDIEFLIDWGDGSITGWIGPIKSGDEIETNHTWEEVGNYTIKAIAMDIHNAQSGWATLEVSMPKNKAKTINTSFFLRFLENFPILYQLLQRLLNL